LAWQTLNRKDKKALKQREREAGRLDTVNNLGDIADFEELRDIVSMAEETGTSRDTTAMQPRATANVEKAMRALQQQQPRQDDGERLRQAEMFAQMLEDGEGFDSGEAGDKKKRRRPAPVDEGADEEEGMLEAFSRRKKEFKDLKKEHYTAEPRYGGIEEAVGGGEKRAATYEIMKNKGLTPHRKKANRNPRVKKRLAYEKAVVRRKGQVREVISGAAAHYGGELTGIKANIARSRKISN
jgi:U3 small nucleolar RNA-associated protein 3